MDLPNSPIPENKELILFKRAYKHYTDHEISQDRLDNDIGKYCISGKYPIYVNSYIQHMKRMRLVC